MKSNSRYSLVRLFPTSSSKSAPKFLCEINLSLESRAHFVDLIFQKCSERLSRLTFLSANRGLGPNPTSWWTRVGRSLGARFTSAMEAFVAIIVCSLHLFGVPFLRWCPAVSFRRPDLPSIVYTLTTCQLRAWKL